MRPSSLQTSLRKPSTARTSRGPRIGVALWALGVALSLATALCASEARAAIQCSAFTYFYAYEWQCQYDPVTASWGWKLPFNGAEITEENIRLLGDPVGWLSRGCHNEVVEEGTRTECYLAEPGDEGECGLGDTVCPAQDELCQRTTNCETVAQCGRPPRPPASQCSGPTPAAVRQGWVLANGQPGSFVPSPDVSYNSVGGTNWVVGLSPGRYEVVFPWLGGNDGNLQVTAVGAGNDRCKVTGRSGSPTPSGLADLHVIVECAPAGGSPTDSPFLLHFLAAKGTGTTATQTGYELYHPINPVSPAFKWSSAGPIPVTTKISVGHTKTRFEGLMHPDAAIAVSAYGPGPAFCYSGGAVTDATGTDVHVLCWNGLGQMVDTSFSLLYVWRQDGVGRSFKVAGYLTADEMTSASYDPDDQWNLSGATNHATRSGAGTYAATYPGVGPFGGSSTVMMSAEALFPVYCKPGPWTIWNGLVSTSGSCFTESGTATNADYSQIFLAHDPLAAPVVAPAPVAVSGLTASSRVTLSWAPSSDATGYTILRRTPGAAFQTLATNVAGPPYVDAGLTNGTTYEYEVVATNSAGSSAPSSVFAVTPSALTGTFLTGDGYLQFKSNPQELAGVQGYNKFIGLTNANPDRSYSSIRHAIYLYAGANGNTPSVQVWENGAQKYVGGGYTASDLFKIKVTGSTVQYIKNSGSGDVVLYTSALAPAFPLFVDTAFAYGPGTFTDVAVSANGAAPAPVESWYDGAGVAVFPSHTLTATTSGGWGSQGIASAATGTFLSGDGYLQFKSNPQELAGVQGYSKFIGLTPVNPDNSYSSIRHAIYLYSGANGNTPSVQVWENGAQKYVGGGYTASDVFKIKVVGGVVQYVKNDVVFYTSALAPVFPLFVDAAFAYGPGTFTDVSLSVNNAAPAPITTWYGTPGVKVSSPSTLTAESFGGWGSQGIASVPW